MPTTIYLHVGYPRCGSSSIQLFATRYQRELLARGVHYPTAQDMGFASQLVANVTTIHLAKDDPIAAVKQILTYTSDHDHDLTLLSSEFLVWLPADVVTLFADMAHRLNLRVIAILYIREQFEWMVSFYAQALKSRRWSITMREYIAHNYTEGSLNYFATWSRLARDFGAENTRLRLFQKRELVGGDIRLDLFHLMGVAVDDLVSGASRDNVSAPVEEVEIMRVANGLAKREEFAAKHFLAWSAQFRKEHGWPEPSALYRLVDSSVANTVRDYHAANNERLREIAFPNRKGPLFSSDIPNEFNSLEEKDRINERSLMLFANYMLKRGARRRKRVRRELKDASTHDKDSRDSDPAQAFP